MLQMCVCVCAVWHEEIQLRIQLISQCITGLLKYVYQEMSCAILVTTTSDAITTFPITQMI